MTTRTEVREQFLADIITTAVEGGTGYWASVAAYKWVDLAAKDVYAVLIDEEDGEAEGVRVAAAREKGGKFSVDEALAIDGGGVYRLDIDAVASGIGKITRGEVQINAELRKTITEASRENDASDIDADAADAITQVALLGELTYG